MIRKALWPLLFAALATGGGTATASAAGGEAAHGEQVFKATCAMCHQTGFGGAPALGNRQDWTPRIAQGKDTLYAHALQGFTGRQGTTPPKGGDASLSDQDVRAAVDYIVSKSQ